MNVIVVDDENLILKGESAIVRRVLPDAQMASFKSAEAALEYADAHRIDIAFLDINMRGYTGLELAQKLQERNPEVNIIFCTGYAEYALDAYDLYASAYLMKPITDEDVRKAVSRLRFPIPEDRKRVRIQCFGHFEVFCDGMPMKFKYGRTKELLAYLVDRKGALMSNGEIMAALFEEDDSGSYTRNIKSDLIKTFQQLEIEDALIQQNKHIGISRDKVDCDYFHYLDGQRDLFHGEYMTQYSFAEETLGGILDAQ